ncbi:MAG TPA: winged helix-turn-helix domain-containing protein [Bryobacteraceae bacterium]|nr:winged helix-turn-helix domain-containing protein [Bryobacteraceae bacterium]
MIYEFGPFRYDPGQRLLFRGAELVPLVPKAIETLHVLLERRGTIVEKSELMKLVWPDTNVEDVGLARNISLLRKALGDESSESPYIETIPRRGYRFAPQRSTPEPAAVPPASHHPRFTMRLWVLAIAGLLVGVFVYYQFYVPSRYLARGSSSAALAVVPFDCRCPAVDSYRWSEGLNDLLVARLSKFDRVQVLAPSTVRRHQHAGVSMGLMGRLLGLDVLIEGTIQKLDSHLQVNVRMVDVHTGRIIWAETYNPPEDDPVAAQNALAASIASEIGERLAR